MLTCGRVLAVLGALALCAACDDPAPSPAPKDLGAADMRPIDLGQDVGQDQGGRDADMASQQALLLSAPGVVLRVDPQAMTLTLWREAGQEPSQALLRWSRESLQVGTVTALSDRVSYNPYGFKVQTPGARPPLKAWRALEQLMIEASSAEGATLALRFEGGVLARLTLTLAQGRVSMTLQPLEHPADELPVYYRLKPQVDPSEGFYGLGEYFDQVEHRGTIRAMQLEIDSELESGYNEAHVPVPLVIGTRGWGLFVQSDWPGVFDVAAGRADELDVMFGGGPHAPQGITAHMLTAQHPLDITQGYYALTGWPRLPARWALGPLIWRDENRDQAEVLSDARAIRALDLATSGLWIDRPYASGVNTFDYSPAMFPDPEGMIRTLHEQGFRVGLWHTPYLDNSEATRALREEATRRGFYPPVAGPRLNPWGTILDLTHDEARAWWRGLVGRYVSGGIEGFKLDYGEDIVPGLLGRRLAWRFADGSDELTMHARFQERYHSVYAEALEREEGYFLLCRGGTWGDQVHGCIIWPGDLDANMLYHRERGTKRDGTSYGAVGGLPAALIAGLSLGPSGYPFYGSDTGGYRHSPVDKETFTRWFEQTALSVVMQIGTSANDVAWEFKPENGFDEEMLGWYRRYTRLHLRLFPYLWSYAERLRQDGRAIQRPLGLAYPQLGQHPSDTYMLGDHLLVAPVVRQGQRERQVILPPGPWIDWWSGQVVAGGRTITVSSPLDHLPLYLSGAGVVPLLRPTIDTMSPVASAAEIDSYATTPGRLWARVGTQVEPGQAASFEVFDGALIEVTAPDAATRRVQTRSGREFKHGVMLELLGLPGQPKGVSWQGQALAPLEGFDPEGPEAAGQGWAWRQGSLWLKLDDGPREVLITLE